MQLLKRVVKDRLVLFKMWTFMYPTGLKALLAFKSLTCSRQRDCIGVIGASYFRTPLLLKIFSCCRNSYWSPVLSISFHLLFHWYLSFLSSCQWLSVRSALFLTWSIKWILN